MHQSLKLKILQMYFDFVVLKYLFTNFYLKSFNLIYSTGIYKTL